MKLTIDTQSDSKDDLRKVIRFLQHVISERDFRSLSDRSTDNPVQESAAVMTDTSQLLSMFDKQNSVTSMPRQVESAKMSPSKQEFKIDFF